MSLDLQPGEFSPRTLQILDMMLHARTLDMPDLVALEAMQTLAVLAAEHENVVPDDAMVTLIGIGALLSRQAEKEMKAGLESIFVIGRAMKR